MLSSSSSFSRWQSRRSRWERAQKAPKSLENPSDTKVDDVVVLTPEKRHAYDQFVKYDDAKGQLYILEDLEVDKSYELRASYSAKTPGKVSVVLVSSQRNDEKKEKKKKERRKVFDDVVKVGNYWTWRK